MSALEIPVWGKTFIQKFVGKNSCLWQSPYGMPHFNINVSIVDFVGEVVLVYDPWREQCECNPHVFEPVEGGGKVNIFDVKAHELGIGCAEHAISMQFPSCDVHCCCEFARVINEITPHCDSDAIGVLFLWLVINHHSGICDDAVCRNQRYVGRGHDKHGICPFLTHFVVPPKSFPNTVIQISAVAGSFMSL